MLLETKRDGQRQTDREGGREAVGDAPKSGSAHFHYTQAHILQFASDTFLQLRVEEYYIRNLGVAPRDLRTKSERI
ncbi:unnamed protein product [Pleuronectes platessa]|uniref:Uncharacterized protein n=1 Tax=Pleuronectes platessa TaxID=8262 RepID=A0A9N7VYJ7_PLEPL|nr:unnamed protein product [Pleuronectes platessa]